MPSFDNKVSVPKLKAYFFQSPDLHMASTWILDDSNVNSQIHSGVRNTSVSSSLPNARIGEASSHLLFQVKCLMGAE